MEFDKSKVYTALNADDLPIGSKCIFANTIGELRRDMRKEFHERILAGVGGEESANRFRSEGLVWYNFAYLVESPNEPKYKPFESIGKARKAINNHGGWVSRRDCENYFFITGYLPNLNSTAAVCIGHIWHTLQELNDDYFFVDDGSSCGELVEE